MHQAFWPEMPSAGWDPGDVVVDRDGDRSIQDSAYLSENMVEMRNRAGMMAQR